MTSWLAERFPNTKPISQEWRSTVRRFPIHRPDSERRIPSTVGTAFDYRLRCSLARFRLEETVAAHGVRLAGPELPALDAFCAGFAAIVQRIDPVGTTLSAPDEEILCRYCYVLALLEELHRGGPSINSPLFTLSESAGLDALLDLAPREWIDDLGALSKLTAPNLEILRREPLYVNPTFAGSREIGGADADLISGGCLIDIKTTVDPKFTRTRLLYQLLGYVLLDYEDAYGISSVGIYLSRQGLLVKWQLNELLTTLANVAPAPIRQLRASFRDAVLATRVATRPQDGPDPGSSEGQAY